MEQQTKHTPEEILEHSHTRLLLMNSQMKDVIQYGYGPDKLEYTTQEVEMNEYWLPLLRNLIETFSTTAAERDSLKSALQMICNYVSMREFDINVLRSMVEQSKIDHNL